MAKTKVLFSCWIRRDLRERIKSAAERENRSMANFVETTLSRAISGADRDEGKDGGTSERQSS